MAEFGTDFGHGIDGAVRRRQPAEEQHDDVTLARGEKKIHDEKGGRMLFLKKALSFSAAVMVASALIYAPPADAASKRAKNTVGGAAIGAGVGYLVGGSDGAKAGAVVGAIAGNRKKR